MAAALYSKFSAPDQGYWSYQFAGTYKINDKNLLRIVYAQANRGAFFTQIYADYRDSRRQLAPNIFSEAIVKGNSDLRLLTSQSIELGYRFDLNDKLSTEIEFFQSDAKDFTSLILRLDTLIQNRAVLIRPTYTQTNIPLEVTQRGITFNLNYTASKRFQTRVFLTLQRTNIKNYSPFVFDPRLNPVANYLTVSDINNYKGTPSVYGGFYMNYAFGKFNINLNGYYFGNQELTHISDGLLRRPPTIASIQGKLLLNLKVSYRPIRQFLLYANARNILFQDGFEYLFTDPVGSIISGGVHYDF